MRKQILSVLLLLLSTTAFGFMGVTGKVELDSNSKQVYRGVEINDNFVLQPKASISAFGLRAKIFNNIMLSPDHDYKKLDETDITLRYDFSKFGFNITPGVKYYHFYNENNDYYNNNKNTAEISLGISYTLLGIVGIYSTHYIDVVKDFGKYYGNLGAAFRFDMLPIIGIEGNMDINWQKPDYRDDSEFTFPYSLNVGAAVKFKPMPLVYVKAHANATILLDGDAQDYQETLGKDPNMLYFGLAVGMEL